MKKSMLSVMVAILMFFLFSVKPLPVEANVFNDPWGDVKWRFDGLTGVMYFYEGTYLGKAEDAPWNRPAPGTNKSIIHPSNVKKIDFTCSPRMPQDSSALFSAIPINGQNREHLAVQTIVRLENLKTEGVTNMSHMFENDKELKSLQLGNFNTKDVTDMSFMFSEASSISTLDIDHFDTKNVIDMSNLFQGLKSVKTLNVSKWNIENTRYMDGMFRGCINLTQLDISNFSNSHEVVSRYAFHNCKNLKEITLGKKNVIKKATSLPEIDTSNGEYSGNWILKSDRSINMGKSSRFLLDYKGEHPGTYTWEDGSQVWGTVPWNFDEKSGELQLTATGNLGKYQESPWNRADKSKISAQSIKKIKIKDNVTAPMDSKYLFSSNVSSNTLTSLTEIEGLDKLSTFIVEDMSSMFYNAKSLKYLDLSSFDTSRVKNNVYLSDMLYQVPLESIRLGRKSILHHSVKLREIPSSQDGVLYTGNWVDTYGRNNYGTSEEFMKAYSGDSNRTYVWEKTQMSTIKFSPNVKNNESISGEMNNVIITNNKYTAPQSEFKKEGYAFSYWTTTPEDIEKNRVYPGDVIDVNFGSTLTLYAQWVPIHYTIKYNNSDSFKTGNDMLNDELSSYSQAMTYDEEDHLLPIKFEKTGYTNLHWKRNALISYANGALVKNLASNEGDYVDLYTEWVPHGYTIEFDPNGGVGTPMASIPATYDESIELPKETFTRPNYLFTGWSTDKTSKKPEFTSQDSVINLTAKDRDHITLYAVWERDRKALASQ